MSEELLNREGPSGPYVFTGEVASADFIGYQQLVDAVGMSFGSTPVTTEGWLRFTNNGKEHLISKLEVRWSVSWNQLDAIDVVYGNKQIVINGKTYKVRLPKGAESDPSIDDRTINNAVGTLESEWSLMFYPLIRDDPVIPAEVRDLNAPYTRAELSFGVTPHNLCQELFPSPGAHVIRNWYGVTGYGPCNDLNPAYVYRPVLEEI